MKKLVYASLLIGCLLAVGFQAQALPITPDDAWQTGLGQEGNQNSQSVIDGIVAGYIGSAVGLYKDDVGVGESGTLAGSYQTVFSNSATDPADALISYTGGPIVDNPAYLLVKDGNHEPWWYLYDLADLGWDGMEDLGLSGFWPNGGAISHVTLYGTSGTNPVPEPGTLLLLGCGLLGLALYGRSRQKNF